MRSRTACQGSGSPSRPERATQAPALELFGRKIEELLLGRGIEEFDREPSHLQAELRRIESSLASDIGQLNPFAGVFSQSLADLLGRDQLVQNLGQPLVPLVREDHALGLAMGTEDDRISLPSLLTKKLQIARQMIPGLSAGNDGLWSCHGLNSSEVVQIYVQIL